MTARSGSSNGHIVSLRDAPSRSGRRSAPRYVLRLYVTGVTRRSRNAVERVREICEQQLAGDYQLEVIDLHQVPALAKGAQIVATPTLIRVLPEPLRRYIGNMTREDLLFGLELREGKTVSAIPEDMENFEELQRRLAEAEQALEAIRSGEVDSLVVDGPRGLSVYALEGEGNTYRVLMETMNEGAATLNETGLIVYCNVHFARLVDLPLQRVMGSRIAEFVAPDQAEELARLLEGARREAVRGEFSILNASGEAIPVQLSVNAFAEEDRLILCLVATDLRAHKRAAALEASEKALREADRRKNEFLAVLSHELRNPLAPVLSAVQLLERTTEAKSPLREPLAIIRRNTQLEARLIDDLLDVSRIAEGKLLLKKERIELSSVIRRAIEITMPDIEKRKVHFAAQLCDEPVHLEGDAARLQQVFWNLLTNAVKFTPESGRIELRCRSEQGQAIIEVTDSGIGIDPGLLERIFDAFEQGSTGVTRQFGGLGLGLAIAKRLVELHDGSISAFSAGRNQGSVFRVVLPVSTS